VATHRAIKSAKAAVQLRMRMLRSRSPQFVLVRFEECMVSPQFALLQYEQRDRQGVMLILSIANASHSHPPTSRMRTNRERSGTNREQVGWPGQIGNRV
jgi:hypothetical protein